MIDLEAIRARDAEMGDADVRFVRKSLADRRALLAYVDELRSRLAAYEVIRTQLIERGDNYQQECAELRSRLAEAERHLMLVLPMAKGYAAAHRVGSNDEIIADAESFLRPVCPRCKLRDYGSDKPLFCTDAECPLRATDSADVRHAVSYGPDADNSLNAGSASHREDGSHG